MAIKFSMKTVFIYFENVSKKGFVFQKKFVHLL
jgi:hypothetical protein